jgi:hypothetical protein
MGERKKEEPTLKIKERDQNEFSLTSVESGWKGMG